MSDWAKWSNCLQKQLPFLKLNIIRCLYIRKFTIQLDKLQESIVTYLVEPDPIKKCPMLRSSRYLNRRLKASVKSLKISVKKSFQKFIYLNYKAQSWFIWFIIVTGI